MSEPGQVQDQAADQNQHQYSSSRYAWYMVVMLTIA